MEWIDYDGQDVSGYDYIGTSTIKYPLQNVEDIDATVRELQRICGRRALIRLFKETTNDDTRRPANC